MVFFLCKKFSVPKILYSAVADIRMTTQPVLNGKYQSAGKAGIFIDRMTALADIMYNINFHLYPRVCFIAASKPIVKMLFSIR